MKQEFCSIQGHNMEECLYVCNELQCIDLNNNKLLCQKCLCKHRGVNYNILKEKASNNYNQYIQTLQNDIDENESLKKKVEQFIKAIQEKIMKMLSDQQKNCYTLVEQQSSKLNINKKKAQQLMQDSPSLDTYIFFAKFSNKTAQEQQEVTKQQVKNIINDFIDDLNQKIDYLKRQNINEYKTLEIEQQSFQIESIFQPKLPYGYCDEHFTKKSSICINIKCLESSDLDYHCVRCCKISHVEHFKNDQLEEYDKLKKQQKIKQRSLETGKQKIKDNAQQLVNNLINQLRIEQKEQYLKQETIIENIKSLQQQFQINLQSKVTKYVFGDLILEFINIKEEELQLQLNYGYQNFEEKLKICRIGNKQKFLDECSLIQLKQVEILKLQKRLQELQQLVDQKDQQLKNNSSENILNQIYTNTQKILKENDKQIRSIQYDNSVHQQQKQLQQQFQYQQQPQLLPQNRPQIVQIEEKKSKQYTPPQKRF